MYYITSCRKNLSKLVEKFKKIKKDNVKKYFDIIKKYVYNIK